MARTARSGESLFHFLDIDAADAGRHPGALDDILSGRIDGMILRGVLSPGAAAGVSERLARGEHGMAPAARPTYADRAKTPEVLGEAIVTNEAGMAHYFASAGKFRSDCRALFAGLGDFEASVEAVLGALSGGLPAEVPRGPAGDTYVSATIRMLHEGQEIGVHVGNEFLALPQAKHLLELLEPHDQLSFFATLAEPEGGGELVVYALEWDDVAPFLPPRESGVPGVYATGTPVFELAEGYAKMAFRPGPGDVLIFNGGRYYHRVSPVVGRRPRRTIGGFLGFSRARDRILYWS